MLDDHNTAQRTVSGHLTGASLVFELGYAIAIPIVICALGGRMMDRHFGTSPLFLLVGIFVAMLVSAYAVYSKVRDIARATTPQQSSAPHTSTKTHR